MTFRDFEKEVAKVRIQESLREGLKSFVGEPSTAAIQAAIRSQIAERLGRFVSESRGEFEVPPIPLPGETPLQQRVNRELRGIDFSRFPWKIEFRWSWEPSPFPPEIDLHLSWRALAKERETGADAFVENRHTVSARELERVLVNWQDGDFLKRFVRDWTREFVLHELDECFLVGGKEGIRPARGRVMAMLPVTFIRKDLSTFTVAMPGGTLHCPPYWKIVDEEKVAGVSARRILAAHDPSTAPVPIAIDTYVKQVLLYEIGDGVQRRVVTYRYLRTE